MVFNKIIIFGIVLLMIPIATAITIGDVPEITLIYDTMENNIHNVDDNIYKVYCDDIGNICDVYRTATRHTTFTGD